MANSNRIQDMPAAQISELLRAHVDGLIGSHTAALEDFVERIGGVENAWAAVRMLNELEEGG